MPKKNSKIDKILNKVSDIFEELFLSLRSVPGEDILHLVLGDNSSGKSLYRKAVYTVSKDLGLECIYISMSARTQGGIGRAFIYGDEAEESTGGNSVKAFLGLLKTSAAREEPHIIFLDEPDLGLSDNMAYSMGIRLHNFLSAPPKNLLGCFLVTHNKALLSVWKNSSPNLIFLGEGVEESLQSWVSKPLIEVGLEEKVNQSFSMWRDINKKLYPSKK
jgi:Fe-S cluster assembly ATPase SufC